MSYLKSLRRGLGLLLQPTTRGKFDMFEFVYIQHFQVNHHVWTFSRKAYDRRKGTQRSENDKTITHNIVP